MQKLVTVVYVLCSIVGKSFPSPLLTNTFKHRFFFSKCHPLSSPKALLFDKKEEDQGHYLNQHWTRGKGKGVPVTYGTDWRCSTINNCGAILKIVRQTWTLVRSRICLIFVIKKQQLKTTFSYFRTNVCPQQALCFSYWPWETDNIM